MGTSEKLYHANLSSQVEGMTRGLNDRLDKLETAKNAFNALVNSQTLKGEAADAMTAYIERVHLSLINLQESAIKTFIRDLAQYDQRYLSVDSDGSFQLIRQEMEDLEKQIPIKQKQVEESKATFQGIMASVADIINPPEGTSLLTHLDNIDRDLPVMEKLIKDQLQGWSDYEDPKYFQETINYLQAAQQMLAENQGVVVPNRPGVHILQGLPLEVPTFFSQTSGAWQVLNKVQNVLHPTGPVKNVVESTSEESKFTWTNLGNAELKEAFGSAIVAAVGNSSISTNVFNNPNFEGNGTPPELLPVAQKALEALAMLPLGAADAVDQEIPGVDIATDTLTALDLEALVGDVGEAEAASEIAIIKIDDLPDDAQQIYNGYMDTRGDSWGTGAYKGMQKDFNTDKIDLGSTYENNPDKYGGGQKLPGATESGQKITYREYDIQPNSGNRGDLRFVQGSDGKTYYTDDHYQTFKEIKK